ncbi:MAG: chorismate mutase [Clostridia bacterium]|nr:chorismate mutase [Clostridia bacterium]
MNLSDYRQQMDEIDTELIRLFAERMETAAKIAEFKRQNGLPVLDRRREEEKLIDVCKQAPEEFQMYTASLYSLLFEFSRSYQNRLITSGGELSGEIRRAIAETPAVFPESATVACQGVAGAYSHRAAKRLFRLPMPMFFADFSAVFTAVEKGLCQYGVIPLENSTAGSVNRVYDLMARYNFRIVRSIRLKVDHDLLVKKGTKREDIREILSHEQALTQCGEFLQKFPHIKITACENTAVAAKMVAESDRNDLAAIASPACIEEYGLDCLEKAVQDSGNNFTRFICIAKNLEIYPGADRTSLTAVLPHEPGSLYKVLSRFYALDINLNKLESRPIPERNFEFRFYFDLDTSVYTERFLQLMDEMPSLCEEFSYFGSYSEVI